MRSVQASLSALLLLAIICSAVVDSVIPPRPPLQNPAQAAVWQHANTVAAGASAGATDRLLGYLDSAGFRQQIVNLTMFSNATAQDLLTVLRSVVLESTLQHNFPVFTAGGFALDVNLTVMAGNGFVPNLYTGVLEGFIPASSAAAPEDYAEVEIMGFPEFANASRPTWPEALTRPQYLCVNTYRIAGGCVGFGEISIVTMPTIRNISLISAVDTGLYSMCCTNSSIAPKNKAFNQLLGQPANGSLCASTGVLSINCSGWNAQIATFDYFDHIFLANAELWDLPLGELLIRRYNQNNLIDSEGIKDAMTSAFLGYYEGDLAGAIDFPHSVQYIQSAITNVFGTVHGYQVRNWTLDNNWPLVWAMGLSSISSPNNQTVPPVYFELDLNNMILDPFGVIGNLSISADDLAMSQKMYLMQWDNIELYLAEFPSQLYNTTFWVGVWREFAQAMPASLYVEYPIGECALLDACFAFSKATGQCVCL